MSETVVLRGEDGAYYFETELYEARKVTGDDGEYSDFSPAEREAARGPADRAGAVEDAGFGTGDPVPGTDIKLGRNPGGSMAVNVGTLGFSVGSLTSGAASKASGRIVY